MESLIEIATAKWVCHVRQTDFQFEGQIAENNAWQGFELWSMCADGIWHKGETQLSSFFLMQIG